jgi:hypothetical protein
MFHIMILLLLKISATQLLSEVIFLEILWYNALKHFIIGQKLIYFLCQSFFHKSYADKCSKKEKSVKFSLF